LENYYLNEGESVELMSFRRFKNMLAWMLVLSVLTSMVLISTVHAEPGQKLKEKFGDAANAGYKIDFYEDNIIYYLDVLGEYAAYGYEPTEGISIELLASENFKASVPNDQVPIWDKLGDKTGNFLIWEKDVRWFEWTVDIDTPGLYNIEVDYYPLVDSKSPVARDLLIDGVETFTEMKGMEMPRFFKDKGKPRINPLGDQVKPGQVEIHRWNTIRLEDVGGIYADPLMFYLSEGTHTLRFVYADQPVAFDKIRIVSPKKLPSYDEVASRYAAKGYKKATKTIKFQAEDHVISKSDTTLVLLGDQDPTNEPYDLEHILMNTIGGWQWRVGNQELSFEFEVEETGLYQIALRSFQYWNDGLPSYRQFKIDGEIPFEEMNSYRLDYHRDWQLRTLENEKGEPYLFYLEKGKHVLTSKIKLGEVAGTIAKLTDDAFFLSVILQKIFLIAGSEPDVNYDYQFHKKIPDLFPNLEVLKENLIEHSRFLLSISSKKSTIIDSINMARTYVEKILKFPEDIVRNLDGLTVAQNAMSSAILSLQQQPLSIDYIYVANPDEKLPNKKSNFFEKMIVTWENFLRSFRVDYDNVGGVMDGDFEVIKVWIARGREWSEAIKDMVDEQFTEKSKIAVSMNVLPASQLNAGAVNVLLLSMSSGTAPDVGLAVAASSPVEFAIRDAVVDLSQFDDFNEVTSRFLPQLMVPFQYRSGTYALPETMNFKLLFYRADIVKDMNLKVPNTWDELCLDTLPELYRNNMQFAFGADYTPFLFQSGASYYNEAGTKSGLDTPEAYNAFVKFTSLYTTYGMPAVQESFYTKIRSGQMPMGISSYAFYIQLAIGAPELKGKWNVAPVPGTLKPDGTIDRSIGGIVDTTGIIISQTNKKEAAWEFLKWWTTRDVQIDFGNEIESLIGSEAKWNTANLEAFRNMGWDRNHLGIIEEQWKWYKEIPIVLGGYFTGRHMTNAWTDVVIEDITPREALEEAVKQINKELRVKQEEYGVDAAAEEARVAALKQQKGSGK